MPIRLPDTHGGIVVVDGTDIDIPDGPIDDPTRDPCRLKAYLDGVYYDGSGDNVGSRWQFHVNINSGSWYSGTRTLSHGQWLGIGETIYDETLEHGCGLTQLIRIFIRARELDWGLWDDIGELLELTAIPCEQKLTQQRVIVMVLVPEYGWRWGRKLLRRFNKTARLFFVLNIETKCA